MPSLKQYYSRIFCQASSKEENLLALGNNEGNIILYDLSVFDSENTSIKLSHPKEISSGHADPIYSMVNSSPFCITGANGLISGWKWTELKDCANAKPSWTIPIECDQANFGTPEVNSLAYDAEKNYLYAACGDWRTRCFDLENGKQVYMLEGHEDYIHDVVFSQNKVCTCGEDGQVLLWDPRSGKVPHVKLKPSTIEGLARPDLGKYISSVDVENEWLVCGGGPRAGIFHLRSLALTSSIKGCSSGYTVTKFTNQNTEGSIVAAGTEPFVRIFSISGSMTSEIATTPRFIYSVHVLEHPITLMTVAGSGPEIDVCRNLNYKDHTAVAYPSS